MNEIPLKASSSTSSSGLERTTSGNSRQDSELDALIFGGQSSSNNDHTQAPPAPISRVDLPRTRSSKNELDDDDELNGSSDGNDSKEYPNVIPIDKLKNGATTASKMFTTGWSKIKDKSSASWEQAKTSAPGTSISAGWQKAVSASTEQWEKVKETDTFKKTSTAAQAGWEKTVTTTNVAVEKIKESEAVKKATLVASAGLERAKQTASSGLEKAKAGAASGIEVIKTRTSNRGSDADSSQGK